MTYNDLPTPSVPAADPAADRTAQLLREHIDYAYDALREAADARAEAVKHIEDLDAHTAEVTEHLNRLLAFRALMNGDYAQIAAADVKAAPGRPGLHIGTLWLGPADNSAEALHAYEETLRRIYDEAISQARQVNDLFRAHAQQPPTGYDGPPPADPALVAGAAAAQPLLDPDCRDGKHGSCMGDPCECFHHVYAHLLGQVVDVVLDDEPRTQIRGKLIGTDDRGVAVADAQGVTNTVNRSVIYMVVLAQTEVAVESERVSEP